jgi:hypothetical protein
MRRGTRFVVAGILCVWVVAVLAVGADMLAAWRSELRGAGQPGGVYVAIWLRLTLLAIVAACPPCLAWALWRIGVWMTDAAQARFQ